MAMSDEEINALNESIRELNDSMKMMADTFESVANQSKKVSDNLNNVSTGAKNADTNTDAMAKATIRSKGALDQFSDSTEEATKRQQAYKEAQASGIQATLGFADALISTEAGFTKFSGALSAAGDAAMDLGKSQGGFGEVLGRIVKAGTIVGEQYLEQADAVLKATDSISRMGAVNTFTADQVRLMGERTGLAWNELDKLIKPMTSMGGALRVLGAGSSDAVENFTKMNEVTQETREAFQRLGLDDEQRIQATADYVNLMFKSNGALTAQQRTQDSLAKGAKAYTENLFVLAEMTGTDIESAKKQQEINRATYEWTLQQNKWTQERLELERKGDEQGLARLDAEIAAANKLIDDVGQLGQFLVLGMNVEEQIRKAKEGAYEQGEFLDQYNRAAQSTMDNVGHAALALSEDFQKSSGLTMETVGKVTDMQVDAAEGMTQVAIANRPRARIAENEAGEGPAATDPAQEARNVMTEASRDVKLFASSLLAETNPLLQGFNKTTIASTALAIAAGAAAVALSAIALKRGAGAIFGGGAGGGGGAGRAAGAADDVADAARTGSRFGRAARTVGRIAGRAALPLAAGMSVYDAYQGFTADTDASTGERFRNAGSSALSGLTFGMLGSDPDEIAARRQDNISAATPAATPAAGVTVPAAPAVEIPWDAMRELASQKFDEKESENIATNIDLLKMFGEAMSSIPEIKPIVIDEGWFSDEIKMPWDIIRDFGEANLPKSDKIIKNVEVVQAFANSAPTLAAISELKPIETGGMLSSLKMPWEVIQDFGNTELPSVKQIQDNQEIINAFTNAVVDMSNIPDIKRIETGIFGGLFSSFDMPWDVINDFGNTELPSVKQIQDNQEIINAFTNAVVDMSNIPEIKMIETGIFGGLFSSFDMPWDVINDFGNTELPSVEQITNNKLVIDAFASAATVMSTIPEIKFSEESADSLDRLTDKLKDFSKLNTGDILENIAALRTLESSTSLVRSINQQTSVPDTSQITNAVASETVTRNTQTATTTNTAPVENSAQALNEQLISMLSQKLDIVIEKLGDSVDIQDRTFRYNI
jgi:hypothetical protein